MSIDDEIWFGRLGVWVGTLLLFLMAITGHSVPVLTPVAVLLIFAGLALLVYGLATGAASTARPDAAVGEERNDEAG